MRRLSKTLLWFFVLTVPLEYAVQIDVVGSISRIAGALALGVGVLDVLFRERLRSAHYLHGSVAAFLIWGGLTYFWSIDPEVTFERIWTYVQLFLVVWLVWEVAREERDQTGLMQAYILGAAIVAVSTVVTSVAGGLDTVTRSSSFGFDPNDQALTLSLAIPMAWSLAIRKESGWLSTSAYLSYLVLAMLAILLTGSRGGVLAMVPALTIILTSYRRLNTRQRLAVLCLIGITGLVALSTVPEYSWQRILSIRDEFQGGDFSKRTYIWSAGMDAFLEHSVLGLGAGGFSPGIVRFLGGPAVAHNTFLSVLTEQGIVGFSLFLGLVGCLVWAVLRLPSAQRNLWLTSLLVWGIGVSSLTWEYRKTTWLLFALIIGQAGSLLARSGDGAGRLPAGLGSFDSGQSPGGKFTPHDI